MAVLLGTAFVASAATDPIAACRAAHAGDSAAHIVCLEDALRASGAAPAAVAKLDGASPAAVAPVAPVAAVPVSGTTAAAPEPRPTGLGAEQAAARQRAPDAAPEQVAVRIVSVTYNAGGLGIFRLADGQVWRETVAAPPRHQLDTGREYAARIERGKVGGYRLYIDGVKWMFKVERLQ
ncbi:MAG: hypothetical protein NDI84_04350 [Steroidobacteraceae bacterium]|nr:hypothetical protein [Steroidobacteraceae bacterium]